MLENTLFGESAALVRAQSRADTQPRANLSNLCMVRNATCKVCADPGKLFWKTFPLKMQKSMEFLVFAKFYQENALYECIFYDYFRYFHKISIRFVLSIEISMEKLI